MDGQERVLPRGERGNGANMRSVRAVLPWANQFHMTSQLFLSNYFSGWKGC